MNYSTQNYLLEIHSDLVGLKVHVSEILNFSEGENELLYDMCHAYGLFRKTENLTI